MAGSVFSLEYLPTKTFLRHALPTRQAGEKISPLAKQALALQWLVTQVVS